MDYCSTCKANWSEGIFTQKCLECGGFAMTRHCPHCEGTCGAVWVREVGMSHDYHEAFYSGGCRKKIAKCDM